MGYARKDVEKTKKIAKKFVRYQEGAELYSIGLTKFQELAKEAKAVYKSRRKSACICCDRYTKRSDKFGKRDIQKSERRIIYPWCGWKNQST